MTLKNPNQQQQQQPPLPSNKRKLKPKKPSSNTPSSTKRTLKKKKSSTSRWISFLLQVLICYILLAYFYFCPKDPSTNPTICRNLAELHWKLAPHLSPYLERFDAEIRSPLRARVDRKLRPIYDQYLGPAWTDHLYPQLSRTWDLSQEYLQRSGLPLQASKLTTLYLAPIRDHVAQRYRQKLLPRLRFLAAQSRQAYSTLTHSALVRTLKTDYLPLLNRFLHHNILRPLRQSVLPNLLNFYQIHLHPHLISLARSSYQTLFIHDNPLKNQLKTLKLTYRNRLLRPVKALHSIYVKPQIRKIVLKLNEYNHNRNSSSPVINTTTTSPIVHQEKVDHQPIPPPVDDDQHHHASALPSSSSATADDDREIPAPSSSLSGADDEDLVQPVIEPVREQEQDKVQATSTDTSPIHAQEQEESESIVEQVSLDHLRSAVEEDDEPASSSPLDTCSPPSSSSPSDDHDLDHDQVESDVGVEESELLPEEIEDDNLTVDVDEFMNEIDDELASTTSSSAPTPESTEPQEGEGEEEEEGGARGRHGPAEIAAQRRDLEALSAELLAKIRETEATQIPALIELLNAKRSAERVSELDELVDREKKPEAIQKEMTRLLERVVKWFDRAETKLGSVLSQQAPEDPGMAKNTIDEQIVQADLVRNKALQKVHQRLISVYLLQLARFKQAQLRLETAQVFEPLWNPVGLFFDTNVARLGHGLTWLSDVTYHDWAVYNRINREVALVKRKLESIMVNGTIPSSSSSSTTVTVSDRAEEPEDPELEDDPTNPDDNEADGDGDGEERKEEQGQEEMIKQRLIRPSFYREIEATEALVDRIHRRFQADLDARYRRFLGRLNQLGRAALAPHLEDPLVEQNQDEEEGGSVGSGRTGEAQSTEPVGSALKTDHPTQAAQTPINHADRDEL
ncbi:hypothetical protein PGT21_014672 [Puccinia graminis f. sp. tritici]|nr:hypothetical protein PGT21_014672 [Puccinia graminis f. sp. tritici]KAA1087996.1 hypothetical protein PGTUg99_016289 [Puccinia graminis f. sp. tritici]